MSYLDAPSKQFEISPVHSVDRLRIHSNIKKLGAALLNQQLWCWGQDVRRLSGNALIEYGFECQRPSEGKRGSTMYTLQPARDCKVILWGFGLFYSQADVGSLFLKRYIFEPKFSPRTEIPLPVWSLEQLPEFRSPRSNSACNSTRHLLAAALRWVGKYEAWAVENLGLEYRRRCIKEWKEAVVPAEWCPTEWLRLADICAESDASI